MEHRSRERKQEGTRKYVGEKRGGRRDGGDDFKERGKEVQIKNQ